MAGTRCMLITTVPYSRRIMLRNRLAAAWKWVLSFRKREWDLDDYPIRIAKLEPNAAFRSPRFNEHDYRASIVYWSVMGSGNTPEEALASLRVNFEALKRTGKQEGTTLVRPGSHSRIEFASQEKVSINEALSNDFIERILELEWAWISDESTLWDFHTELSNASLHAKILKVYGVDVSDIDPAKLWEIFERIEESQRSPGIKLPT